MSSERIKLDRTFSIQGTSKVSYDTNSIVKIFKLKSEFYAKIVKTLLLRCLPYVQCF